jgi:ABC-type Fe3+ transport system substrate-binding protein
VSTQLSISAEDRVLVTSLADRAHLRALAAGRVLVGLGTDDEVRAARRELADLDNVMFVVGGRADIPWQPCSPQ